MEELRRLIREMLKEEEVLAEPDLSMEDEHEKEEQSVAAAVAGVTTPLGTNATYPDKPKKNRKNKK